MSCRREKLSAFPPMSFMKDRILTTSPWCFSATATKRRRKTSPKPVGSATKSTKKPASGSSTSTAGDRIWECWRISSYGRDFSDSQKPGWFYPPGLCLRLDEKSRPSLHVESSTRRESKKNRHLLSSCRLQRREHFSRSFIHLPDRGSERLEV